MEPSQKKNEIKTSSKNSRIMIIPVSPIQANEAFIIYYPSTGVLRVSYGCEFQIRIRLESLEPSRRRGVQKFRVNSFSSTVLKG